MAVRPLPFTLPRTTDPSLLYSGVCQACIRRGWGLHVSFKYYYFA